MTKETWPSLHVSFPSKAQRGGLRLLPGKTQKKLPSNQITLNPLDTSGAGDIREVIWRRSVEKIDSFALQIFNLVTLDLFEDFLEG